jgi:hypothetical protein
MLQVGTTEEEQEQEEKEEDVSSEDKVHQIMQSIRRHSIFY